MRHVPISRVKDLRVRLLLSRRALAEQAGVSYDTVARAERGIRISALSAARIARVLGIDWLEIALEPEESTA